MPGIIDFKKISFVGLVSIYVKMRFVSGTADRKIYSVGAHFCCLILLKKNSLTLDVLGGSGSTYLEETAARFISDNMSGAVGAKIACTLFFPFCFSVECLLFDFNDYGEKISKLFVPRVLLSISSYKSQQTIRVERQMINETRFKILICMDILIFVSLSFASTNFGAIFMWGTFLILF